MAFSFFKKNKTRKGKYCTAVVAAAGSSSRMEGENKLLLSLDGIPVLVRTLQALQRAEHVNSIVIATREADLLEVSQLCKTYGIDKCQKVVCGGETRVHSVLQAALEADTRTELIAVQDGARPMVTPQLIDRVIQAAERCGAAAPAVPMKDTIKMVREDGTIVETLPRENLRAVQTPQVFDAVILKAALQSALEQNIPVTDDCAAVERLGKVVFLVEGDERNLKITTPSDLILAEALIRTGGEYF